MVVYQNNKINIYLATLDCMTSTILLRLVRKNTHKKHCSLLHVSQFWEILLMLYNIGDLFCNFFLVKPNMPACRKTTSSNRHAELDHTGKQDFFFFNQKTNQKPTNQPTNQTNTSSSPAPQKTAGKIS